MKLIINIDDNVFTRLFDNGVDTSSDDREVIDRAVRNGKPYEERPHGHWIVDEEHSITITFYKCTNCDYFGGALHYNYCPHCGADMRCKEKQE